jgi:hypothetical protein
MCAARFLMWRVFYKTGRPFVDFFVIRKTTAKAWTKNGQKPVFREFPGFEVVLILQFDAFQPGS